MIVQPDVPFSLEEIDVDWLTMALRENGMLEEESVTGFSHRIVGEETGFLGEVAILELDYSNPACSAPKSLVLKIPTALKNRQLGQTMGVYEKEIRFYRELKSKLKVRAPEHYYSALDVVDDPDVILARLKGINQLPMWLIRFLLMLFGLLSAYVPRRYVLLIEDLSKYRLGDQVGGCSEDDVRKALETMATFHAQFWGSEELDRMTWIAPVAYTSRVIHSMYRQSAKKLKSANEGLLSERQTRLIDWLYEHGIELSEAQGEHPRTLLHGDFRLDNICFDDDSDDVLLFDWQTMQSGSAGMDLAYFLSAAMPLETPESKIDELIEIYRHKLNELGVEVSRERMRWQYEVGMLSNLHRIAPALYQDQIEFGEERGPELINGWIDKTFGKLEGIEFEGILDRKPA